MNLENRQSIDGMKNDFFLSGLIAIKNAINQHTKGKNFSLTSYVNQKFSSRFLPISSYAIDTCTTASPSLDNHVTISSLRDVLNTTRKEIVTSLINYTRKKRFVLPNLNHPIKRTVSESAYKHTVPAHLYLIQAYSVEVNNDFKTLVSEDQGLLSIDRETRIKSFNKQHLTIILHQVTPDRRPKSNLALSRRTDKTTKPEYISDNN